MTGQDHYRDGAGFDETEPNLNRPILSRARIPSPKSSEFRLRRKNDTDHAG
jgi:hypothetical protein